MATIRTLASRVDKLERRCNQHGEFQIAEVNYPGDEFWAACQFAMIRNGVPVFRFPHRLSFDEWQTRFCPNQPRN